MAICHDELEGPIAALCRLDEASMLAVNKSNAKYYYTKGKSLMMLNQYEEAHDFYTLAFDIEPNNTKIGEDLIELNAMLARQEDLKPSYLKNIFNLPI